MWKDPEPDPGGDTQKGSSPEKTPQELSDLKEQNEQQQLLIAQLKEMLRKEQSNVTQEKVEEYVNTLSKVKSKRSRMKKDEPGNVERSISSSSSSIDNTKKQKLNLLKQQLEENKAKLAERGKNQKGIEEMVIQLKAQLNDSQQLIPQNFSILEAKNLEYNKNSSQEELYNILLTKERKITDLLNKIQKQEVQILDLEENLKEKDSVIDARTKAITLMTDSLSKKGKNTLDALDETKEQMRKMQENFITLEGEMKARQVKLLNELKAKNLEITELQENNQNLSEEKLEYVKIIETYKESETGQIQKDYEDTIQSLQKQLHDSYSENENNLLKISELEKKLQDSIDDINRLKNTGITVSTEPSNDEEISKLKKQLEENNKNMIKVKAQSKSKIKELNKKLDQFKKANDANALIVQLQNENTKLSEKIAELEEEKGNMQLKMVESTDSLKDSQHIEEIQELENKLTKSLLENEEKDKVISLLESEIISLKEQSKTLEEKISNLSHLESVKVSAEIKSIQLEEQLEKVEHEKLKLKEEIENLLRKNEEMVEQIEEVKREKQEISSKLDNYIQENMELIDKLEKLSAEKVSSAESIEIVEGLTQQEKLELAAYQKTLDVHIESEPMKCPEDDHIESPTELNESVLQLSEDSTELLQRIDMFTMERKEVMTKLEDLKEENNQLVLKLKEIENNRDILAETYEQLQTEKEVLQNENDALTKKLQDLEQQSGNSQGQLKKHDSTESVELAKLQELQSKYENLLEENLVLKGTIKEYDLRIHEKHNLESELKEARSKIEELETKIHANLKEITNYQSIMEENKHELINSASLINDLQAKLEAREKDIEDLNIIINDLNGLVNNLQIENSKLGNFELMETQVDELKTALNEQIQQAQDYEEEIARNNDIISDLNTKLMEMNKRIIEAEHESEMKEMNNKKLVDDLQIKDETIKNLQAQIEEKDKKIAVVVQEMKEKYLSLQKQLDGNSDSLEIKIVELTNKNREQMDKMKKIAANLKKKSQAYQELEEKYKEEKEKWETEVNEKEVLIINSQDKISKILQQIKHLEEEINHKNAKLLDMDNKIKELTSIIQNFEQNNIDLQNTIIELKHRQQKLTEVSLKQELSTSLHEDFDNIPSNQDSAKEEKIKELELIIETNEADIAHCNERIHKLEENIARLEQEKDVLIQQTGELSEQLNITSRSVEEKSFMEEQLGEKLLQVTANDEVLIKKLQELTEENKELLQKNKDMEEITLKLKIKLKKAHERVTQLKTLQTNMEELENNNRELKKQVALLEANQKHIQDENLELQKRNKNDYEKIEADYQIQLEELVKCKNDLTVECEKLRESLKEMELREEDLLSEITEYKQKMEEKDAANKEKLEELNDELRVANFNWKDSVNEIEVLRQYIKYLEKELINKIATETLESIVTEAEDRIRSMRKIGNQTEKVEDEIRNMSSAEVQTEKAPVQIGKVVPSSEGEYKSSQIDTVKESDISESFIKTTVQSEIVPTFHWPGSQQSDLFTDVLPNIQNNTSNDWFNNQQQTENVPQLNPLYSAPQLQETFKDNTKVELLNKIKALEFLLYNMDKEKEEAFQECTRMVNELTRLLYERVNSGKQESVPSESHKELHQPLSDIESQVMSESDVTDGASKIKELQNIEYEKTDPTLGEQSHAVIEEVIQPKRAYLTYHPENVKPEVFGENDDGWGWGPEEAKLEEEHQFSAESAPQVQNLRMEIARLNENLQVLQVERENHLEEIKQLQVKSGKLIKKCKELKQKNDQLMEKQQNKRSEGVDFFDLDATIQEELKSQIAQLEKKVKEITNELEREKLEKTNILKRVDVLTAANDRFTEMKEIQDTEILHWKRKHQELEEKVQQYEWGSDGFNKGTKVMSKQQPQSSSSTKDSEKIEELQQTIKELALDNEELQVLLEEQRKLRMDLEKAKTTPEANRIEQESKKLLLLEDKVKFLEQELELKIGQLQTILNDKDNIFAQNQELQRLIKEKEEYIHNLQENLKFVTERSTEFERLLAENDKLLKDLKDIQNNEKMQNNLVDKIKELQTELDQLKQYQVQQDDILKEKEIGLSQLMSSIEEVNVLKEQLEIQVQRLTNDLEQQIQKYDDLQVENSKTILELQNEVTNQKQQYEDLKSKHEEKINTLSSELGEQKKTNEFLQLDSTTKLNSLSQELEQEKFKYNQLHSEYVQKIEELEKVNQEFQNRQNEYSVKDTFEIAQEKFQLESLLAEKETALIELRTQKEGLEKQIGDLTQNLEQKQNDFEQLSNEFDEKISRTVKELEENWMIQVDQRGADVAESWKLHLESVEAEFGSIQEKLKNEINELEAKCNALVNENNELRKNVDAEIRNEVDRISALQQQITDAQRYITELNNTLIEKQNENETLIAKLSALETEKQQLLNDLRDKDGKLSSLNIVLDTTQKQFEDKRQVVEEVVKILERNTSSPISFEKRDVLNEFQRQLNLLNIKEQEISKLNQEINNLQSQFDSLRGKDEEIFRLNEHIQDLQNQLDLLREKDVEISRLSKLVEESQNQLRVLHEKDEELFNMNKLVGDLQKEAGLVNEKDGEIQKLNDFIRTLQQDLLILEEKDREIVRLNQIIENYKVRENASQQELDKCRQDQATANIAIEDYKRKLEEFNTAYVTLQNTLEEKNQLITTLNQQLQVTEGLSNDSNKDAEKLQQDLLQAKKDCSMLQQSLADCQEQLFSITNELTSKSNQLGTVNQQLIYSQQKCEFQESELNELRDLLLSKEYEYNNSLENFRRTHLQNLESHYDELLAAKNLDIETIRSQLNESIQNSNQLTEKISAEENLKHQLQARVQELEEKLVEQATLLNEEDKQLSDLRAIIEEQVIKIEELKKDLFAKSNDYDSLIAEMDIGRKAITQQPTHSAQVEKSTVSERRQPPEDDLSEPVSRAELDLALYMLHQRDVRCEELTVELTQLLEERDTLQLRLSNALREKEEARRKLKGSDDVPVPSTSSASSPSTPHSKSSAVFLSASGTEVATEPLESDLQNLESKLSELKRVGYKKDKTFVDEQEFRRIQQMSIMQQHINEASKLPPEAAAKLVDASYTLSRDVQSPSKVLLNWLWGKSTPKVNDT